MAGAAQAYIVVDSKTGYILQQQEPKQKRQIGSLTKIATAVVTLDWAERKSGNLGQVATVPAQAFVGVTENHIGFQPGDRIELRGFGVFNVRPRKTGIGRNPRTGAEVTITPGKAVRFKPGKELHLLDS